MSIENKWSTVSDCWIHDLTTMKWKKVICVVYTCIRYCMFGFGLQLPLSDTVTERVEHSLSAIQLSPHKMLLVAFGGWRSLGGDKLSSHTVLIDSEYNMYCTIVAIMTDTAQWYWCTV